MPVEIKLNRLSKRIILAVYILFSLAASVQSYLRSKKHINNSEVAYTKYNNYIIFKQSFYHLINDRDLYSVYPEEHWDLYKYTPSFSLAFGVFAVLPDLAGLICWNLLNALVLFFAIWYLPGISQPGKKWISLLVLVELMTSLQNEQSNGLIAGLIVFAIGFLERKRYAFASLVLLFSSFIKIFRLGGFVLFLFYPQKWKALIYSLCFGSLLFALPLLVITPEQYYSQMSSYTGMLSADYDMSYGYSVMGWLQSWFGFDPGKNIVILAGLILFLIPFLRTRQYQNYSFRLLLLSSLLIWLVIFNHKAESPTFIIAVTGVAIWFVQSRKTILDISLLILCMLLTSFSPTDIFPRLVRDNYVTPYCLKAVPCILIWLKIQFDIFKLSYKEELVT